MRETEVVRWRHGTSKHGTGAAKTYLPPPEYSHIPKKILISWPMCATHDHPLRYISFLRVQAVIPRIFSCPVLDEPGVEKKRLSLENEPSGGRPVGPQVPFIQPKHLFTPE
jgi:hypothetical protein